MHRRSMKTMIHHMIILNKDYNMINGLTMKYYMLHDTANLAFY